MFLSDLYKVITKEKAEAEKTRFVIELNAKHEIFKGHFPGNPILPGVCTVQIIKELLEEAEHKKLVMTRAHTIKYLSFINPVTARKISVDLQTKILETGMIYCTATVHNEGKNYCSFKGEFRSPE